MVELVAPGYDTVTVGGLAERARVSKRDFYKHFAGKEDCFLATYETIVNRSLCGILAAIEGEEEWRERLRHSFLTFAGQIAGNPKAAHLALVEAYAAGAVVAERMQHAHRLFEALLAKSIGGAGGSPRLPQLVVKGIVAGCGRVARARLLSGRPEQLALDGNELMEWALSFCSEEAVRLHGLGVAEAPAVPETTAQLPLGDERSMILAATAKLASKGGYATLTVPRVRAVAGVSRRSFDANFEGVTDCFLAALEMLSDRTLTAAEPSYLTADDWASGVHRMIASLCRHLAGDPTFASLAFLEVFSPGPEAIQWRSGMIARLARMLQQGAPQGQQPTAFAAKASVGAIWGVMHHFVASGRGSQLPLAAPALSYIALAPALGGAAAVEAITAEIGTISPEQLLHPA